MMRCALFVLALGLFVNAQRDSRAAKVNIIRNLINPEVNNWEVSPPGTGMNASGPVTVTVNSYIRGILDLDLLNQEMTVQITFREEWTDSRLRYQAPTGVQYVSLSTPDQKIWTPDPFFSNEKAAFKHDVPSPNYYLRVFPDGKVLRSQRLTLRLSCPTEFSKFPYDSHACSMIVASYGYTTEDVVLLWKASDPIQVTKNLHLPHFTLMKFTTDYCTSKTNTGEYSCLKAQFFFSRNYSTYTKYHAASVLALLLAFASLWINHQSLTARLVTIFFAFALHVLALCNLSKLTPEISYSTLADVSHAWINLLLLAALLETLIIQFFARRDEPASPENYEEVPDGKSKLLVYVKRTKESASRWSWTKKLDVISRILFGLFLIVYFTWHASREVGIED